MQNRNRINACILSAFGLTGVFGLSQAQEADIPDIRPDVLSTIGRELECGRPKVKNAILGCAILAEFSVASSPDPEVLKAGSTSGGRRWIGITVISDKSSQPHEGLQGSSPFQTLVVLAARYSTNFHKKLYFENGVGYSYIWPQDSREVTMIDLAAKALLHGSIDTNNPVIPFAQQVNLRIDPTRPSTGKSLMLGAPYLFMRQRGNYLYMIEVGSSKETDKYYLSRIRLNALIK